jgi:hypothetical protein
VRRLQSIEDEKQDVVTYEFADGKRIQLDGRAVSEYGVASLLRGTEYGDLLPTERLPVYQRGKVIGSVPGTFDPETIKSTSFFYDVRRGDFIREGDGWTAAKNLGDGDLYAVPGFVWGPPY